MQTQDQALTQLIDMGFEDVERSSRALATSGGDVDTAVALLLQWSATDCARSAGVIVPSDDPVARRRPISAFEASSRSILGLRQGAFGWRSPDAFEQLRVLREMGFKNVKANYEALEAANGNFEIAVNRLVSDRKQSPSVGELMEDIYPRKERNPREIRRELARETFKRREERELIRKRELEERRKNITREIELLTKEKHEAVRSENFTRADVLRKQIHCLKHWIDPKNVDANPDVQLRQKEIEMITEMEMSKRILETLMAAFATTIPNEIPLPRISALRVIAGAIATNPGLLSLKQRFQLLLTTQDLGNGVEDHGNIFDLWNGNLNVTKDKRVLRAIEGARLNLLEAYPYIRSSVYRIAREEMGKGRLSKYTPLSEVEAGYEVVLGGRTLPETGMRKNTSEHNVTSDRLEQGLLRARLSEMAIEKRTYNRLRREELRQRKQLRERQVEALKGFLSSELLAEDSGSRDIVPPKFDVKKIGEEGVSLIKNVNLKLVAGRRYGLVGRNGAGKTTLLKLLADYQIQGVPKYYRIFFVEQVQSQHE